MRSVPSTWPCLPHRVHQVLAGYITCPQPLTSLSHPLAYAVLDNVLPACVTQQLRKTISVPMHLFQPDFIRQDIYVDATPNSATVVHDNDLEIFTCNFMYEFPIFVTEFCAVALATLLLYPQQIRIHTYNMGVLLFSKKRMSY